MALPKSGTYNVVLEIPEVLHHAGKSFVVCPSVYSRLLPTGIVDPSSVLKPTADSYCSNVVWTGADSPNPTKRKLWAVMVGFSGSSHLAAPALQFAHEDAINFARFLQLEASRELPGATGGSAPNPYFDDIAMRLLVSSPSLSNNQSIAQNAKIKELQKFGDAKFVVVYPQAGDNYKDLVAQSINDVFKDITVFQRTHADDGIDWQHAILVYFSGHGFSQKDEQDPQTPYMRTGLVTPSSKNDLENGSIWVDELLKQLLGSRYLSIVIVDACRGPADQSAALPFDSQLANLSAYPHLNIDAQRNQIHILYSSQVGHYSYEASQYDVADFVPQLKLWPPAIGTKGGGLFSLGLLSSLMCEDALQGDPNFTLQNAKDFLRRYFFSQSNAKWRDIEAQLKTDLANRKLVYTKPDPAYDPFGSPDRAVLREGTAKAPKCFSAASQ